jgi:LmbE family N-acetylglucosaminyl deacetylase
MKAKAIRDVRLIAILLCTILVPILAFAESPGKALLVVAHPDDEYYFAATVYRMAVQLGGRVDELIITNGEGGFRYSTLAEPYYHKTLTTEAIGRQELPAIRKQETLNAGKILGIKEHFFLGQKDARFSTDEEDGQRHGWNTASITNEIESLVKQEHYSFIFCILPRPTTHGGHQEATVLAANAIQELPEALRPALLGFDTDPTDFNPTEGPQAHEGWSPKYAYAFDRTTKFGFHRALDYQIVVDWMIAEHKSQGMLQTLCEKDAKEYIWIDNANAAQDSIAAKSLFFLLAPGSERQGGLQ